MLGCVFGQTVLMKALRFVELWGTSISASHSGNMVGAPWYVRNADLHRDLRMDMVMAEVKDSQGNTKRDFSIIIT